MSRAKTTGVAALLVLTHLAVFLAARHQPAPEPSPAAATADASAAPGRGGKSSRRDGGGPTHAQLWQKLLEAKLSRPEFEKSRAKLLDDWARHDLGAVLDLVQGPRSTFEDFYATDVIREEIARQGEQVLAWIREGRFGTKRQEMYNTWFGALKRDGQSEFILASLAEATPYEKRWSLQGLLGNDATGPLLGGIRASFDTWFKDDPMRGPIIESYARWQAGLAAGDVSALFSKESDPQVRNALGYAWLSKRIGYPPPVDRLGEILQLPEDARGGAVSNLINYYDDAGLTAVRPALAEMNRLGLWKEMAGSAGQQTVSYLAGRSHGNPQEILDPLLAITDAGARAVLLEAAGRGMSGGKNDAQTLAKVAEAIPAGADRDACLAGMVRIIAGSRNKADLARQGYEQIADPARRAALLKEFPDLEK